jgi:hypothetical protein
MLKSSMSAIFLPRNLRGKTNSEMQQLFMSEVLTTEFECN